MDLPRVSLPRVEPCDDPHGPIFEGRYAGAAPVGAGAFVIVTYNIRDGQAIEEAAGAFEAQESLRSADIILLQEMDEVGVEQMARQLQANYVYCPASVSRNGRSFGNAILTRWPLRDTRKLMLPYRRPITGEARVAVRATVEMGGRDILVHSVHTETYTTPASHRKAQVAAIVDDIGPGESPVIVGGDLNTVSKRSTRRMVEQFEAIGLTRATSGVGPTIAKLGIKPAAPDHIFTRGFDGMAAGKMEDTSISDHFAVWVQLASRTGGLGSGGHGPC